MDNVVYLDTHQIWQTERDMVGVSNMNNDILLWISLPLSMSQQYPSGNYIFMAAHTSIINCIVICQYGNKYILNFMCTIVKVNF